MKIRRNALVPSKCMTEFWPFHRYLKSDSISLPSLPPSQSRIFKQKETPILNLYNKVTINTINVFYLLILPRIVPLNNSFINERQLSYPDFFSFLLLSAKKMKSLLLLTVT